MGKLKIPKETVISNFKEKYNDWDLIVYNGTGNECIVRHKCGRERTYKKYQTMYNNGPLCSICDKHWEFDYQIGDVLDNIEIIDRKSITSGDKRGGKVTKLYKYKCHKCGFDGSKPCYKNGEEILEYWIDENSLKNGIRCSCCYSRVVQVGINDIATTHPDFIKYFVDQDAPHKYTYGSTVKQQFVCPICKHNYQSEISIYSFINGGHACANCEPNTSYPERFMYFLLTDLNVKFERNKVFEWSKKVENTDGTFGYKEYDFYLPEYNIIIETHGKQHYDDSVSFSKYGDRGRTLKQEQENDIIKMKLAIDNGFNYIVINCSRSTLNFIRKNILDSNLRNILCLDNINWNKCHEKSLYGIKALIIQDKRNNPDINGVELSNKYNVPHTTIYRWLDEAMNDYKSKIFFAVYSPELDQIFTDFNEASSVAGVSAKAIRKCAHHPTELKHAGKHPGTGERLTWVGYTKKEYEAYCNNSINLINNIC